MEIMDDYTTTPSIPKRTPPMERGRIAVVDKLYKVIIWDFEVYTPHSALRAPH
jgi:hypothetical protein